MRLGRVAPGGLGVSSKLFDQPRRLMFGGLGAIGDLAGGVGSGVGYISSFDGDSESVAFVP
jgi:hypothetical protein